MSNLLLPLRYNSDRERPMGDIVSSCVVDLDATLQASYGGAGTDFLNVENSPADGELQSEYDFEGVGAAMPTFTGATGNGSAYFLFDGADQLLGKNTLSAFLDSLHKTTGGTDFAFVVSVYHVSGTQVFASTKSAGTAALLGVYLYSTSATDGLFLGQRGDTSAEISQSSTPLTAGEWNFIGVSHSHSTNETRLWVNSSMAKVESKTFNTTTTTASGTNFSIGAYTEGTLPLTAGARVKSFQAFNSYLTNADMANVLQQLNIRHNQDYEFKPSDIATNALWLDASDSDTLTESGNSVSQWEDKSGLGNHFPQEAGSNQPTTNVDTQNGLNVVTFGATAFMDVPSGLHSIPNDDNTVFTVSLRDTEAGGTVYVLSMTEGGSVRHYTRFSATAGNVLFHNDTGALGGISNSGNTNTQHQITTGFKSGSTQSLSIDGGTATTNTNANNESGVDGGALGSLGGAQFLLGKIAEVIIYSSKISASNIARVNGYLATKWGITLA